MACIPKADGTPLIGVCCLPPNGVSFRITQLIARCTATGSSENLSWVDAMCAQAIGILDRYDIPEVWSSTRYIGVDIVDGVEENLADSLDVRQGVALASAGVAHNATINTNGPAPSYATRNISFLEITISKGLFRGRPFLATAYVEQRNGTNVSVDCSRLRNPPEYSLPGVYTFQSAPRFTSLANTGVRTLESGRYFARYSFTVGWNETRIPPLIGC